jgi:hypothetical protein
MQIDFAEKGGISAYYSSNMLISDLKLIKEFMLSQSMSLRTSRAFKINDHTYEITLASINKS